MLNRVKSVGDTILMSASHASGISCLIIMVLVYDGRERVQQGPTWVKGTDEHINLNESHIFLSFSISW